jgi:outer membrane receptor protein involved in Fe transport
VESESPPTTVGRLRTPARCRVEQTGRRCSARRRVPGNVSPTYDRGPLFSTRVGLSYNGSSIFQYQYQVGANTPDLGPHGPGGDVYFYPHLQLDAQASYRVRKDLTFLVQGLNLTNEVFGFYNGSPDYVLQREYYNRTYSFGLRWEPRREF